MSRIKTRDRRLGWSALVLALVCLFAPGSGRADPLAESAALIRERLIYPREATFPLPAALPSLNHSGEENREFLKIAEHLKSVGLARFTPNAGGMKLAVEDGAYDLVRQNINLAYELLGLNLILGQWEIDITRMEEVEGGLLVHGREILIDPTTLFDPVLSSLAPTRQKNWKTRDTRWRIVGRGKDLTVESVDLP